MQNDIQEKAVYNYPLNDNIYNERPEAEARSEEHTSELQSRQPAKLMSE